MSSLKIKIIEQITQIGCSHKNFVSAIAAAPLLVATVCGMYEEGHVAYHYIILTILLVPSVSGSTSTVMSLSFVVSICFMCESPDV